MQKMDSCALLALSALNVIVLVVQISSTFKAVCGGVILRGSTNAPIFQHRSTKHLKSLLCSRYASAPIEALAIMRIHGLFDSSHNTCCVDSSLNMCCKLFAELYVWIFEYSETRFSQSLDRQIIVFLLIT